MNEQEFIDIVLEENDSLAFVLNQIVEQKKEETGSYNIAVQNVIPVRKNHFTVILHKVVSNF
ncbi:hypothetical protein QUF88_13880 [Bacillus sp. DX1.1]|uniref:hypothetical protein n=1 Tax=unclassified Bacillus (in: firmicutes) TaxID=185979 RepID=UPI002570F582|nr:MULTISPECIES: hypothetical protein [unclassified Bacillus (in: firmicutes)]MDM5154872.1 hypothetical protein [Bacillus sp. DX1.1]WJE83745.1 hypothetical protein QRE67_11375 [Bacillus sp. DX3.1]